MAGHIVSIKLYALIFITLLVMTGVTTAVGYVDLGRWNIIIALAIAIFKASLVILFFMHMKYAGKLPRLVFASTLLWLAILITLTMSDVLTRSWDHPPQGWQSLSTSGQR
ncbi:MAG: cytochrome C oxidase subunit IV family protein [Acidobacteriia bacterium]|nr:cytochrome C oxidase subunit IV family protein [Terriglobia bacterium]